KLMQSRGAQREDMERKIEERGHWKSKTEFLLAVAGNVVGMGNVWRFPYLCYKNGGGVFLVPYLVYVVTCGIPLFLLDTAMGQYTQEGGITCWHRLCPLAEGIGYAAQLIQLYSMCYMVILAWALFYLVFSFSSQLPWASCDNAWNTDNCEIVGRKPTLNWTRQTNSTSAATEFWEKPHTKAVVYFVAIEGIITSVTDVFPRVLRGDGRREIFLLLFCLFCFFSQLIIVTEGGMYWFQLFDYYACSGACVLFLAIFESVAIGWIFGADRLCEVIEDMTGCYPNFIFRLCWKYLTPLISLVTLIYSLVDFEPLTFNRWYVYPDWAYGLGWLMALSSIIMVPGWALGRLWTAKGSLKQVRMD
ncbi:hypothetical protein NFI96_027832, partial [Prochilodus magdalenae]